MSRYRYRYMHCPYPLCKTKTRHDECITTTMPAFFGIVHGFACQNCGRMKIANNMRVRKHDEDEGRWATKEELKAMRRADKERIAEGERILATSRNASRADGAGV